MPANLDDGTIIIEFGGTPETVFVMGDNESVYVESDPATDIEVYETFPLPSYVIDIKTYRDQTEALMLASIERYKGTYNPLVAYTALDIVTYNGSSYIATDNVVAGVIPPAGVWEMLAEKGAQGDDGWAVPIQRIVHAGGALNIAYGSGKTAEITINGNTVLTFSGWPPDLFLARLTLLIHNSGGHSVDFPNSVLWVGAEPTVSTGDDWYAVSTVDGGASLYGHVIGQLYGV